MIAIKSRWSAWRRGPVGRSGTAVTSIVVAFLICSLAACGGSSTARHASATPTPSATPVSHGWSTIPSPGVAQEGNFAGVTALSAADGWAVGQYEGLDSLQRTLTERWNGSQWTYQPSPSPGQRYNLLQAVSGASASDVWAVGYQMDTDRVEQPLIEHWNGTAWSVSPAPSIGETSGQLSGVAAVSSTNAWVVGFTTIPAAGNHGPGQQPLIEHWDGTAWSIVNGAAIPLPPDGSQPYNNLAAVVALSAGNVWAVGGDNSVGNAGTQALIEHWDGHAWTLMQGANPNSNGNALSSIAAVSPTNIWAVGSGSLRGPHGCGLGSSAIIEHWDGTRWSSVSAAQPGNGRGFSLASVAAASASDVWAVGGLWEVSSITPVLEHWNGSQWSLVASPVGNTARGLTGVAAAPGGPVLTVGQYEGADGPAATLAEQETGGTISVVTSASPGTVFNSLHGVATISANDVWAVGSSANGTLAEHWNGTAWTVSTTPNAAPYSDSLDAVAAASTNDVWAVGTAGSAASIQHWNGNQWAVASASVPQYSALSGVVALSATNAWAVGSSNGPLVEHWDGATWSAVATPRGASGSYLNGETLLGVAAVSANDIWAVGANTSLNCGGQLPALIEHWNGSSWSVIPNLPNGILIGVTAVSARDVWAVGSGDNGALILHWDGNQWSPITPATPAAHTYPVLRSVAAHGTADVWAVGGDYHAAVVEHWDGHTWSNVPVSTPGVADNVLLGVTAVANGELWAVGEYDNLNFNRSYAHQALIEHYTP